MILGGHAYSETKPRKIGIGIRAGLNMGQVLFNDENGQDYTASDHYDDLDINKSNTEIRFPFFFQFDEILLNNWAFTTWVAHFDTANYIDTPPSLKSGGRYRKLVEENTSNGVINQFSVPSNLTHISNFKSKFPQYQSKIDSMSEPSLSADMNISAIFLSKSYGIFIPVSNRHRLLEIGVGLGVSYNLGNYAVNLCDPFLITGKIMKGVTGDSFEGICRNKFEIFSKNLSHFGLILTLPFSLYSYIGDSFEFNFFNGVSSQNIYEIGAEESPLKPQISYPFIDYFSVLYAF